MSDIGFKLNGDNSNFRAMVENSHNMVTKFGSVLNTLGIGIGAAAVVGFFRDVIEHTGKLQDLSDRLGVNTDHLQAFDLAVRQAGGSTEQANQAWDKARKALDNLAIGTPAVVDQFAALKLNAASFQGLGLAESLELISKGYADNAQSAGAYDAVTDLLGAKSAPSLLAVINQLGTEAFPALLKALDESGNKIDKDTIAQIDRVGDAWDRAKGKATSWGAKTLGLVLDVTEGMATGIAGWKHMFDGTSPYAKMAEDAKKAEVAVKPVAGAMLELNEIGKKSVQTDIEKSKLSRERLDRETRLALLMSDEYNIEQALAQQGLNKSVTDALNITLAETRKGIRVEEQAIAKEEEKHAARMQELTAKEIEDAREKLGFREQMAALRQDEQGWIAVMGDHEATMEVRRNAEFELAKTRAKMRDVEGDRKKQDLELAHLLLIPTEQLTATDKLRIDVLRGVTTEKALDAERTQLIAGLVAGVLTPAERDRLSVLMGQQAALQTQLETAKAITATVGRTGKGVDSQSDDSLEGVRNKLRADVQRLERDRFGQIGGVGQIGGLGKSSEQYLLESELFNLEKEMNQRKEVRDFAGRFGEQKARAEFGDTRTDKALRDWSDQQTATTVGVQNIENILTRVFGGKK
jgi:hypothetical protein